MTATLTTYFQLSAVGFALGFSSPCIFTCLPLAASYIAGSRLTTLKALSQILLFLSGRFSAAVFYGLLAGLSGRLLRVFPHVAVKYVRPAGGAIILMMAVFVLAGRHWHGKFQTLVFGRILTGGIFFLGLAMGLAPCPPFIAVFTQILLMSRNAADGIFYGFFFGAGLFASGFITLVPAVIFAGGVWSRIIKSKMAGIVFRIICAAILVVFALKWLL